VNEERVGIVTGSSGAIGSAIRNALEDAGVTVLGVDLHGGDLAADVGTAEGNRRMVELAMERYGRLDILVLNAGVQWVAPLRDFPEGQWDRLMNVLAKGPFLAMQAAWDHLIDEPGKRIVVVSSGAGLAGQPFKAAYTSAKHAVIGLVRAAAMEGAPYGLTVNAVAPGWVWTGLTEGQLPELARLYGMGQVDLRQRLRATPAGRNVDVLEVASIVAFLASGVASGINGAVVPVDLGWSAGAGLGSAQVDAILESRDRR
jgi:3-hydroxybutyrate dehydrogenase